MAKGPFVMGLIAVDIEESAKRGELAVMERMHQGLYEIVRKALEDVGITWDPARVGDRGDGLVAAIPADHVKDLVNPLVARIRAHLDTYNASASEPAKIRLRVSAHVGYVRFANDEGVPALVGPDVNHVFRLLDAPEVKRRAKAGGGLAVVVSDQYYSHVVTVTGGLPGRHDFDSVRIKIKETAGKAWIWVVPRRHQVPRQMPYPEPSARRPPTGLDEGSGVRTEDGEPTDQQITGLLSYLGPDDGADPGESDHSTWP